MRSGFRRLRTIQGLWVGLRRENVPLVAVVSLAMLAVSAFLILLAEQGGTGPIQGLGESLWYAVTTMTSVGYGDYTPVSLGGRLVGVMLMLGGVLILSVFTAAVASALVAQRIKEDRGLDVVKLQNHMLLCGWNAHGSRVLDALVAAHGGRLEVVLVNELPEETMSEILARHRGQRTVYVRGDPALEATLERANVTRARAAIVLADTARGQSASDDRTTLVTLVLKSLKPDLRVTAEALELTSETYLRRAGADDVVISGEFRGFLLASAAVAPGVSEVVRPLLSPSGSELSRVAIPREFIGRSYGELAASLRRRDGFLAIAVVSESPHLSLDDLLTDDPSLVDQFIKEQFVEAGREDPRSEGGATRALVNPPDTYEIGPHDAVVGIPRSSMT